MTDHEKKIITVAAHWLTMAGRIQGEAMGIMRGLSTCYPEAPSDQPGMLANVYTHVKAISQVLEDFIRDFPTHKTEEDERD